MSEDPYARAMEQDFGEVEHRLPDDLIEELDKELDNLEMTAEEEMALAAEEAERADGLSPDPGIRQMQETYLELAQNALAPVSRYIKALTLGETSRELLEISEMVISPLISRTEAVGLERHAEDLTFFRSLLQLALGERDQTGSAAMREVVMEGFHKLSERFDVHFRGYRLAVRNLVEFYRALRDSEEISDIDVRKFFAIGIPSLTWVRRTRVFEMTSLSGIPSDVMTQIRKLAYMYRSVPPANRSVLAREDRLAKIPENIPRREEDFEFIVECVEDASVADVEVRTTVPGEA